MEKRSPLPKRDGINSAAKPTSTGPLISAAPAAFTASNPVRIALRIPDDDAGGRRIVLEAKDKTGLVEATAPEAGYTCWISAE
ncbi:hypothetical protein [Pseudomonas neuropathica]|uniref:hypothetical protein n=1 Tax=Pseudomonas neuropathica TaxID=2730425 RepID=UPI001E46B6ED|nr:hypothetical protein [Pseudomonas neuropathica]